MSTAKVLDFISKVDNEFKKDLKARVTCLILFCYPNQVGEYLGELNKFLKNNKGKEFDHSALGELANILLISFNAEDREDARIKACREFRRRLYELGIPEELLWEEG